MSLHFKKLLESCIRNIGGAVGRKIRYFYYKGQFKSCGNNVIIEEGVFFESPETMHFGSNVWIDKHTILLGGAFNPKDRQFHVKGSQELSWGDLIISDGVHIAPFSLIQAHGGVKIGENVTVASGSKIYSLSHHYKNLDDPLDSKRYSFSTMAKKEDQFMIIGNVIIGDNAAIGLNSVILPGSIVPNGTWIGVLSALSSKDSLEPNTVFSAK
ncbi:MAG: hypothetical protein ABIO60_08395 [Aquaticitalea sp.]